METIDIILLIPLLWGGYKGFQKGFLMEIVTIIAFFIAIVGSFKLMQYAIAVLGANFEINAKILPYVAFIVLFIGIVILVNLLGRITKKVLDMTLLGSVDNIVGGILGVLKWAFGLSVVLWVTTSFGIGFPDAWTDEAFIYPYVLQFAPIVSDYSSVILPFADGLFESIKELLSPVSH